MYQIQATVAMEQQQVISELQQQEFVLERKATLRLLIRTSYQNIPEAHTGTDSEENVKRSSKKDSLYRRFHKNFIEALPMNIPEDMRQRRASSGSLCKDLLRMISTGSPQDLLTRTEIMQGSLRGSSGSLQEILARD